MFRCCLCLMFLFYLCTNVCEGLECYVCKSQEGNVDKCLNTIMTCEHGDDMCLTDIRWGSTPYWEQGTRKQYYVSKRCGTKHECERERKEKMPYCTYVWYLDWKCSDCCSGDRCNYYVVLSGSTAKASILVLSASLFAVLGMGRQYYGQT